MAVVARKSAQQSHIRITVAASMDVKYPAGLRTALLAALVAGPIAATGACSSPTYVDFGDDNRAEPFSDSVANWQRKLGASVAMIVDVAQVSEDDSGISFETMSLSDWLRSTTGLPLCKGARFSEQQVIRPVAGRRTPCTGFLVDDQTLLTAKHCVSNSAECSRTRIAFDYEMLPDQSVRPLSSGDLFACSAVEPSPDLDFSVVRLDRASKRPALVRSPRVLETDLPVLLVGHPVGLPLKFTLNGNVQSVGTGVFTTNLDAYSGNSGSPVISSEDGRVVGLQVRGGIKGDWMVAKDDSGIKCMKSRRCNATPDGWNCPGGEAIRADAIATHAGWGQ